MPKTLLPHKLPASVVHIQDDEVPVAGANCTWLLDVLRLFESKPKLGILGMRGFVYLENGDITDNHQPNKFVDPVTGLSFSYASVVDNAPTAWRAQTYREISGWDETLGETGARPCVRVDRPTLQVSLPRLCV